MSIILKDTVTTNENHLNVKLQFNEEFRRFFIPNTSIKFIDLESKIKSLLKITENEILIKYKDEENEWITISSDVELETGLIIAGNGQLFRLLCIMKNDTNNSTGEDEMNVPRWKKNRQENYPKKDKKWKKNSERGGKEKCESEISNLTPEPSSHLHEDNANEDNEPKKWKGERRQKKEKQQRGKRDRKGDGERRKKNRDEEDESNGSSSESNSDIALLTLDEIKVEIAKLREEESILKEKVRGAKESWKVAKDSVNVKRREDNVQPDVILSLREDLENKKKEKERVLGQLRNTRDRMKKLREAAQTKQV